MPLDVLYFASADFLPDTKRGSERMPLPGRVYALGSGVWGSGFRVKVSGFRVWGRGECMLNAVTCLVGLGGWLASPTNKKI